MPSQAEILYHLIVEIRGAFNDLKAYSDQANADLGITAATRAVLEYLTQNGPTAVPDIARAKNVSRQHIQQLADGAVVAGLCSWRENPRHKRSQLLAITGEGTRRFAEIRKREAQALGDLVAGLDSAALDASADTLARLRAELARINGSQDQQ